MAKNKDFFGFNKAINWNKLKDPKVLKELEKIFKEKKLTSERANIIKKNLCKMFNFVRIYSGVSKALYLLEATTSFPAIFKTNKRASEQKG